MVEIFLALCPILLVVLKSIISGRYSVEGKKKRADYERDKELANQDSMGISRRLSNGLGRIRLYNRKKRRRNTP